MVEFLHYVLIEESELDSVEKAVREKMLPYWEFAKVEPFESKCGCRIEQIVEAVRNSEPSCNETFEERWEIAAKKSKAIPNCTNCEGKGVVLYNDNLNEMYSRYELEETHFIKQDGSYGYLEKVDTLLNKDKLEDFPASLLTPNGWEIAFDYENGPESDLPLKYALGQYPEHFVVATKCKLASSFM